MFRVEVDLLSVLAIIGDGAAALNSCNYGCFGTGVSGLLQLLLLLLLRRRRLLFSALCSDALRHVQE